MILAISTSATCTFKGEEISTKAQNIDTYSRCTPYTTCEVRRGIPQGNLGAKMVHNL